VTEPTDDQLLAAYARGQDSAFDELAPHVFPLWELINDFKTAEVPVLMLPYGFGETSDAMLEFYREHL
jgi:hypothetical protein